MKLVWDKAGERYYETGVDRGVLYPRKEGKYTKGVAWNGLTGVSESPSGAEPTPLYADNIKYLNLTSTEEFGASIEAYTYPDEFDECQGMNAIGEGISIGQQEHTHFGLSYRTLIGNDDDGNEHGYKLHLVYNCLAQPSEKAYSTVNDSPEAITFSWEISTTPEEVPDKKPTASITIDSRKVKPAVLKAIEDVLYGTEDNEPKLPTPTELIEIIKTAEAA